MTDPQRNVRRTRIRTRALQDRKLQRTLARLRPVRPKIMLQDPNLARMWQKTGEERVATYLG